MANGNNGNQFRDDEIIILRVNNVAPRSPAQRDGVSCAELRRSPPRLRSHELRRDRLANPLCSKLRSILAKANEQ